MELDFINLVITIIIGLIIGYAYSGYIAPYRDKYLTFWPRFWAPTFDEIVLWVPTSIIPYSICQILGLEGNAINLLYSYVYFIYYVYSIYLHGAYGATIGKMITKVKVVDAITEGPITFKQAIIRDSIPLILSVILIIYVPLSVDNINEADIESLYFMPLILGLWFVAEVITMLTNKKRRALHDYIAGTVVIRSNIEEQ